MRSRFRLVWLLPFAPPVIFASLILFLVWDQYRPRPLTPDSQPREILLTTLELTLLNSFDKCIAGAVNQNVLLAIDHHVAYVHSDGTPNGPYIRSQDVFQTEASWQSAGTPYPYSMVAFGDRLFLSSSLEVRALSLASGELVWRSEVLPGHAGNVISADPRGALTIYYTQDALPEMAAVILHLDPQTGSLIEKQAYRISDFALMAPFTRQGVLWISGDDIWFSPTPTDPAIWRVETGGRIAQWPPQYHNLLLVSSGFFPEILAIDSDTGEIAWEDQREFASLPVIFRGLVYAITKDAKLIALQPETGQERGSIQFSPQTTQDSSRSHLYAVASSSEILAVYFGDSCQLFVFEPPAA